MLFWQLWTWTPSKTQGYWGFPAQTFHQSVQKAAAQPKYQDIQILGLPNQWHPWLVNSEDIGVSELQVYHSTIRGFGELWLPRCCQQAAWWLARASRLPALLGGSWPNICCSVIQGEVQSRAGYLGVWHVPWQKNKIPICMLFSHTLC